MNTTKRILMPGSIPRWLIATGIAIGLMFPLSASADHDGNRVAEVLVSTALAYAVIDAVGGFDDKDRHRRDRYRKRHHDRDYRYWERKHRHRARHDHRRHHRRHCHKHWRHHAKYRANHRYGSGDNHYRRAHSAYYAHR